MRRHACEITHLMADACIWILAALSLHRKTVITVAASKLPTILLQKRLVCASLAKQEEAIARFFGPPSISQEARSAHGRRCRSCAISRPQRRCDTKICILEPGRESGSDSGEDVRMHNDMKDFLAQCSTIYNRSGSYCEHDSQLSICQCHVLRRGLALAATTFPV